MLDFTIVQNENCLRKKIFNYWPSAKAYGTNYKSLSDLKLYKIIDASYETDNFFCVNEWFEETVEVSLKNKIVH